MTTAATPVAEPAQPVASPAAPAAESPVVAAPVPETPAVVEAPTTDVPAASAATEVPKTDAAPAEAAAVPETPTAETPKPDAAAEAPKPEGEPAAPKYEFKIPETVKMDTAQVSAYSNVLGKYNIPPEAGQELMDFGANLIKAESDRMQQSQLDAWNETNATWQQEYQKRAGNRADTILNETKQVVIDTLSPKERTAFWNAMGATGAGNHPDVIMAMHKIAKRLSEGTAPSADLPRGDPKKSGSPADRRYGSRT